MPANHINYNNTLILDNSPIFTIHNRAFRYGDGLFETIRIIDGNPCFLDAHIKRLFKGMNILKMNAPADFNYEFIESGIRKLLKANNINKGGRVRINVFRNDGGYYTPPTNDISFIIEAKPIEHNSYTLNEKGYNIDVFENHKKSINDLSHIKSINCLTYILAGIYKIEKQLDDCVILNDTGKIAEGISSNIFVVNNNILYTPSVSQGCVEGVMRMQIIKMANHNGIKVNECSLAPSTLLKADEVFLTNVINGIRWVGSYQQKRYFNRMAKLLSRKLGE